MATIVIKDLPENVDLDREAMQAVTGGARLRGQAPARALRSRNRGSSPPAGVPREAGPKGVRRPVPSVLFK